MGTYDKFVKSKKPGYCLEKVRRRYPEAFRSDEHEEMATSGREDKLFEIAKFIPLTCEKTFYEFLRVADFDEAGDPGNVQWVKPCEMSEETEMASLDPKRNLNITGTRGQSGGGGDGPNWT